MKVIPFPHGPLLIMAMSQVSALVLPVVNEPSLATRDWLGNTTKFSYDADGNLTTEAYPYGLSAVSAFDHADLLTSITHKTSSGTLASQAQHPAGNSRSATEPTTSKPPAATANAARGAPRVADNHRPDSIVWAAGEDPSHAA